MRYLKCAPSLAIAMLEENGTDLSKFTEEERLMAVALLTDERMNEAWPKLTARHERRGFNAQLSNRLDRGVVFFTMVLSSYQTATHPESWQELTRSEQVKWLDKLDRLVDKMDFHLKSGPSIRPVNLGSHVPYEVREQLRGESVSDGGRGKPWDVEWSLVDSLKFYASNLRENVTDDQWMKRPRHPKAARERFIYELSCKCELVFGELMQEVVAITAGVVFNDDSTSARLVRRITIESLNRQDSSEKS